MNIRKYLLLLVALIISTSVLADLAPDELVRKTADDVINELKKDKDIKVGDRAKIYKLAEEKILPNFDFKRICRLVLGKNWRSMTVDQRNVFQIEFRGLLLRTYAIALSKFRDQTIEFKPLRMKSSDKIVLVKTEITQSGGQPIDVNYALSNSTGKWLVFDIVIEGVSLVTNYRSQFASQVKKNGIEDLLKKLSEKNNESD
jgi:phospholipid transport system substrate-binding protein|tara:strand:- start:1291 stop:1893 length:603 start_codon:yes stop_codon:yes gene_type:complete